MRKKVLQIIPNLQLGGAEVMLENLSYALADDGFDVAVVSLYDDRTAITSRIEEKGIPIYYLGKKLGPDIKIVWRLYKLFKKLKPDVIHTHIYAMTYAIPAAILARTPKKVHTIHNIAEKEVGGLLRRIYSLFYKFSNVIPVSISPNVKKSVIKEYPMLDEGCVPMIYNGINLDRCITKEDYSIKNDIIKIVHVANFKESKNHSGLIESFKVVHDQFPNARLNLIGIGPLQDNMREMVNELGLKEYVDFLGLKEDVYPYLYEADVFVLPSLWEGMPISIIEAMATGLPIVVTKVGGIPDMIEDYETGILVDTDTTQITRALLKLIKNQELRARLGKRAKEASKRFSVKIMAEKYETIYEMGHDQKSH